MSSRGTSIAPRSNLAPSPAAMANSPGSPGEMMPAPVKTISGDAGVKQIITSREWVLPPRPKPGRKPSVDTPASKRKAQNRAAQRAFRERRATRVQELEVKLLEVEKEKEVKEMGLVNTINKLKMENQFLLKSLEQLKSDVHDLRRSTGSSSSEGPSTTTQNSVANLKATGFSNNISSPLNQSLGSPASSLYSVQQISPAPSADSPPILNGSSHHSSSVHNNYFSPGHGISKLTEAVLTPFTSNNTPNRTVNQISESNFDCGVCLKDDCLCESVGLKEIDPDKKKKLEESISSIKPMKAVPLSKKRKSQDVETEIDFTVQFTTAKKMPDLKKLKKSSNDSPYNNKIFTLREEKKEESSNEFNESSPVENCGFCSDDTPCVCREAAKEAARLNESLQQKGSDKVEEEEEKTSLPPIQLKNNIIRKTSLPVMHPGPSVEIREITNLTPGAVPTVVTSTTRPGGSVAQNSDGTNTESSSSESPSKASGCTGDPGTCEQCQMDPMSTLFCTTVASKSKDDSDGEETEQSVSPSAASAPSPIRTDSKTSIPSLKSITNPSTPINPPSPNTAGMFIPCADAYKTLSRHKKFNSVDFSTLVGKLTTRGMQVEVQSVANVLRELDRRLYN